MMARTPSPQLFTHTGQGSDAACESLSEPLARVMTMLGKRWTGVVVSTLMQGSVFFSELKRGIPGISDRILNERLIELVELRLVSRTVIEGPPIRVQYGLTEHGAAMRPAIDELTKWAELHLSRIERDKGPKPPSTS